MPVLHEGYNSFFQENKDLDEVYLLDRQFLRNFDELEYIKKDIRALDVDQVKTALDALSYGFEVKIVKSEADFPELSEEKVVISNDDVGLFIRANLLKDLPKERIETSTVFLRWDKNLAEKGVNRNEAVEMTRGDFEQKIIKMAFDEADKSADWWRKVGSVLIKDEKVILTSFNRHLSQNDEHYRNGDPRCFYQSGEGIEMASSIHSETALIAEAARRGISLEGASLYVTTFPCPHCSRAIAHSGIKNVYFAKGYSALDGLDLMTSYGVKVTQVILEDNLLKEIIEAEKESSHVKDCYI